jgi:exopolyphosphatase/guanosine-5'-triphosphate,3'-diphosphate pyrophosphatase
MDGEPTAGAPIPRSSLEKGRVGIIDVGSNSIRLVVYERASRAPLPVFNEKVLCGLARGLDATGRLNPEGVEMALANIDRFTTLAHNMKVTSLDLLATAAVRDAADGADFMRELERRPGIKAHIVSGRDEARFSGLGVICGMPDASGVMGDLGGGSLELVALADGELGESSTLPVGPLRLMSSGKGDPKRTVIDAIESVRWLREEVGKTFYAVGGAWRSFAPAHGAGGLPAARHPPLRDRGRRGARRRPADRRAERQVAGEDAGCVAPPRRHPAARLSRA